MSQDLDARPEPRRRGPSRRGRSMLGPIWLIAIGILLLLNNTGRLPDLNWVAAIRLWPLLLVILGINLIVRQAPRPVGTFLSALVAVGAVALFAAVLVYADETPALEWVNNSGSFGVVRETISAPANGVNRADMTFSLGSTPSNVYALEDNPNLVDGEISYRGDLVFTTNTSDGLAEVALSVGDNSGPTIWWDPVSWFDLDDGEEWQIGLNRTVPLELRVDMSSGPADLDLEELMVEGLTIKGGSGRLEVTLPDGDYQISMDLGSGRSEIELPNQGWQQLQIDGGSGRLIFRAPANFEGQFTLQDASADKLNLDDQEFVLLSDEDEEVIWETPGYQEADDKVSIILSAGSGRVSFESR